MLICKSQNCIESLVIVLQICYLSTQFCYFLLILNLEFLFLSISFIQISSMIIFQFSLSIVKSNELIFEVVLSSIKLFDFFFVFFLLLGNLLIEMNPIKLIIFLQSLFIFLKLNNFLFFCKMLFNQLYFFCCELIFLFCEFLYFFLEVRNLLGFSICF